MTDHAAPRKSALSVLSVAALLVAGAAPLLAQPAWPALRPMPIVTLEIRKLVGMLMFVPAVTLFLLYLFRPRPYVLAGVASWIAGGVMLLVLSVDTGAAASTAGQLSSGRLAVAAWAFSSLAFGASLRCATRASIPTCSMNGHARCSTTRARTTSSSSHRRDSTFLTGSSEPQSGCRKETVRRDCR